MQVIGALIGKQKGRSIEIFNTFELKFDVVENSIVIDRDFYTIREEQFKQVRSGSSEMRTKGKEFVSVCDV